MAADIRIRDQLRSWLPWWLQDRHLSSGKSSGYRFLWVIVATLDVIAEWIIQGLQAAWPGQGTPTALSYIGNSRGIVRGIADTDDDYAARLRRWLDKWANAGTAKQLSEELHEYFGARPRVRVVNRNGAWATCNTDGSFSFATQAFDWDSVSNPSRAGFWSELFVIVYTTEFGDAGNWGAGDGQTWGALDGFGHGNTLNQRTAAQQIIANFKAARSHVRAIVFTSDNTLFDPATPASLPDGNWGQWSDPATSSPRAPSSRITTTCRYWESEQI